MMNKMNRKLLIYFVVATGLVFQGSAAIAATGTTDCPNSEISPDTTMDHPRSNLGSTVMKDGRIFVFGGRGAEGSVWESEIYDPVSGQWSPVPSGQLSPKPSILGVSKAVANSPAVVTLPDGQILVVTQSELINQGYLYDDNNKMWSITPPFLTSAPAAYGSKGMASPLAVLGDGRVLHVAGSYANLYDPAENAWKRVAAPVHSRTGHSLVSLADGGALLIGGYQSRKQRVLYPTHSYATESELFYATEAELFDPATEQWTSAGHMAQGRNKHTATVLADGRVAVIGGRRTYK